MDWVTGILVLFALWGIGSKIDNLTRAIMGLPGWEPYEEPEEEDDEESQDS